MNEDVFDEIRSGGEISVRTYNLLIGCCLLWGFLINIIIVKNVNARALVEGGSYILFIIGYFISCFAGIALTRSDKPLVSFIGYNLVVVPFGLCVAIVLEVLSLPTTVVLSTIIVTAIITLIMMIIGMAFPEFVSKLGRFLGTALIITIIIEIIGLFFFPQVFAITDIVVALIFIGYIAYDWYKAQNCEKTVDNAIDSACELYMDIINLFIRLLEIFGRSSGGKRSSR